MLISEESYDRVQEAIDSIGYAVDTDGDYRQWIDVAASCVTDSFEGLEDNQIYMTCGAWIEEIQNETNKNLAYGYANALMLALKELVEHKERFLLECQLDSESDDYNEHEAVIIKKAFEGCVEWVKEDLGDYLQEGSVTYANI